VRRFWRCLGTGGGTAVEFALIAPVLLMLVVGTIDVGRLLWTRNTIEEGVAAAGRYVMAHPTASALDVIATAKSSMLGIDTTGVTVTAAQDSVGAVNYMTVTAGCDFHFLLSLLPAGAVHLTSKARVPLL
jgi:Flp pilus assembly protein TadG